MGRTSRSDLPIPSVSFSSPILISMPFLAMLSYADLRWFCGRFRVLEETADGVGCLNPYRWPVEPSGDYNQYGMRRLVRQALFAATTFPCLPIWFSWMGSPGATTVNTPATTRTVLNVIPAEFETLADIVASSVYSFASKVAGVVTTTDHFP